MAAYDLTLFPDPRNHLRVKDLTGLRFGRLTVVAFGGVKLRTGWTRAYWICRCDCSIWRAVWASSLKTGESTSCGCYHTEQQEIKGTTHGQARSSLYRRWNAMIQRCVNANSGSFKNYGGRGVTVCDRWRDSFENFLADVGQPPFSGAQLDRIDNDGNYEPGNVKWSTRKQQLRNTRRNHILEFNGERKCVADWAKIRGWPKDVLLARLRYGWPVERALTEPVRLRRKGG